MPSDLFATPVWCQTISSYLHVPERVLLCFFGFLAIVNVYTMRLCLDMALPHMLIKPCKETTTVATIKRAQPFNITRILLRSRPTNRINITRIFKRSRRATSTIASATVTYDWSTQMQTMILASFYVGYVLGHVPGVVLAQKHGGKWVLAVGIFATGLLTLLTPSAIRFGGPMMLIVLRLLIGFGVGPAFPALSTLLAQWVPAKERGKLGVLVLSGGQVGVSVANFMSGLLMQLYDNWSAIFYFFGFCALLWFSLFSLLCYSDPGSHPYMQTQERTYLQQEIKSTTSITELAPTPWRAIFRSAPMWALISATVQHDWSQFGQTAEVPKMMENVREQSLTDSIYSSLRASMPFILKWLVSLASGYMSDELVERKILSTTNVRKIMTSIAAFGPRIFTSFASCLSCERESGFLPLLNCAMGVVGTYYAGIKLTPLDMSPNYAGTLMGIANGIGSVTALLVPHWEKLIPPSNVLQELRGLLWVACTALSSGELQPFNDPPAPNE